jgi:hypothetical protein
LDAALLYVAQPDAVKLDLGVCLGRHAVLQVGALQGAL